MKTVAILALAFASVAWSQTKPCPSEHGVYVLEGDGWKPLQPSFPSKIIQGHMQAMGRPGMIAIFPDGESALRVKSNRPVFCAPGVHSPESFHLVAVQSRNNERRVIVAKIQTWKGSYGVHPLWFEPEAAVPIKAGSELTFSPDIPIRAGEYAIFIDLPDSLPRGSSIDPHLVKGYDFGYFSR